MMNAVKSRIKVVNFHTRDFMGSVDIANVIKVIALPGLNLIPESPDYIVGMFNLAGRIIPVIDLPMRLQISIPTQYTTNMAVIICRTNHGEEFGLLVDAVNDISDVSEQMMESTRGDNERVIDGEIKYENNISLLINANSILGG